MRSSTGGLGAYFAVPSEDVKAFPELLRRAGIYTLNDGKLDYQFSGPSARSGPFSVWDWEGSRDWSGANGQPFFAMFNFLETHESGVMSTEGEPRSASHAQTIAFRRQSGMEAPRVTDPARVELPPYYPDVREVRADVARHYDNIHLMDQRVGAVLKKLGDDGLADSTIVIWTTDHGDGLPRAKRDLFDSGLRVPLMIHFPAGLAPQGWQPGETDERMISFIDLAPTILRMAGVAPASYHQGHDFLVSSRQYVYASRDRIDEVTDRQRAVRDERFKYIKSWYPDVPGGHRLLYRDNLDMVVRMREMYERGELDANASRWFEPVGVEQLYDLRNDPDELHNLIGHPDYQIERQRLATELAAWQVRVGDMSEVSETQMRDALLVDGSVGQTIAPVFNHTSTGIELSAPNNASIGYRVNGGRWRLYTGTLTPESSTLEAKAVRYGWQESVVQIYTID